MSASVKRTLSSAKNGANPGSAPEIGLFRSVKSNPGTGDVRENGHRDGASSSKGRKYPANVSEFARRLYESGLSLTQVQLALARQGYRPARSTVTYWCDPEAYEAHNLRNKRRLYPHGRTRTRTLPWQVKQRRMMALREAGLSFTAICKVMALDFGLSIDHEQVRRIINGTVSVSTTRRLLS